MMLDRTGIAARIPHAGNMCLLDAVEMWDSDRIICCTQSHRCADNPLRSAGSLGITIGIEYAAQAMAVHGALLAGNESAPAAGFLVSVREVHWHRDRLDDVTDDLIVRADRISATPMNILYTFAISVDNATLISGRAAVIVDAGTK